MTAKESRLLTVGQQIFCTVRGTGAYGWWRVQAIRPRDGYIKLSGYSMWCPPHNFSLSDETKGPNNGTD